MQRNFLAYGSTDDYAVQQQQADNVLEHNAMN